MSSPIEIYDETGTQRLKGTQRPPGGGSQIVKCVRVPVAFNTPNLTVSTSPITAVDLLANSVSIAGDFTSRINAGKSLQIIGSASNDGGYTTTTATFVGGQTVIVLDQPLVDATVGGAVAADQIGGITVYQPSEGDVLLTAMWSVTTVWNGAGPDGKLVVEGDDPFTYDISFDLTTPNFLFGQWSAIVGWSPTQSPLIFGSGPGALIALVDNGSGGDPGADQGEGEIILVILAAA